MVVVGQSCTTIEPPDESAGNTDTTNYSDWNDASHGKVILPDYEIVFNQQEVLRIDIVISQSNWYTMQNNLTINLKPGGNPPVQGGPGIGFDPVWVPCFFHFKGKQWYHAGIRFKGNSSLRTPYQTGIQKLSFKLDFDHFEKVYPQIKNQRFYGFKQLNLNNNFSDLSLMNEKIATDLFRDFGMVAARTAFCAVYVDHGAGPVYFGLYTLVEEVDDTVLQSQFGNNDGNLYKPEGPGATFAQGTFNPAQMNLKNKVSDFADVRSLYDIINNPKRMTDPSEWKSDLMAVFDVDRFLQWLAANTVMQNWDSYGKMSQNYLLYNNPETHLLTWIPWDLNEALQPGKQGGALSLSLLEVGNNWPLIRYVLDHPDFREIYLQKISQFINGVFSPDRVMPIIEQKYRLIQESAYAEKQPHSFLRNTNEFDHAVGVLKNHVIARHQAATEFVQ